MSSAFDQPIESFLANDCSKYSFVLNVIKLSMLVVIQSTTKTRLQTTLLGTPLSRATSCDPKTQSHTLDPASEAAISTLTL